MIDILAVFTIYKKLFDENIEGHEYEENATPYDRLMDNIDNNIDDIDINDYIKALPDSEKELNETKKSD